MEYPQNPAPSNHPIAPLIGKRWSPMAFSDKPLAEEQVNSLLEAGRWAPSSYNEQPWRFIYATKDQPEEFDKLASLLLEGNSWAKNAYMLILACAIPTFSRNDKPNRHHQYDTGAAMENIFLQAAHMDLIAHEMAGFDYEGANAALNIPAEVTALAMMAIGHRGEFAELPEDQKDREKAPRERKPLSEIAFRGSWQA